MDRGQNVIIGLGALAAVGVAAVLLMSRGGDGTSGDLDKGPATAETAAPTTGPAPEPLPAPVTGGSGAVVATARATHYDPDNPPVAPPPKFLDYVCKRNVSPDNSITHKHMGTTYHFCSEKCLDEFKKDPVALLTKRSLGE